MHVYSHKFLVRQIVIGGTEIGIHTGIRRRHILAQPQSVGCLLLLQPLHAACDGSCPGTQFR